MSNDRLVSVLGETAKVGVAAWGALGLEPYLPDDWPAIASYAVAGLAGALALELLLQIVFGVPRIRIVWGLLNDPVEIEQIVVRPSGLQPVTDQFRLKLIIPPISVLGMLILRGLMRFRPTLAIRMDEAPMAPMVKDSRIRKSATTVNANDATRGFDVYLGNALTRSGDWHWATVLWRCEQLHDDVTFHVNYRWVHRSRWVRILLWLVIRRPTNVRDVRMIRR